MVNTLFDTVWRDISPFAVGFDRTFDTLSIMANSKSQSINYPPYNIRKVSDEKYTIELAIAGFDEGIPPKNQVVRTYRYKNISI